MISRDKPVFCTDCKYIKWDEFQEAYCTNEKMYLYRRTPVEIKTIIDCNNLNSFNDCKGFEKK